MTVDFGEITSQRKRAIRAEMLKRFKQKLRKKGASRAAGGNPKLAGGTGSMKGFGLTAGEIKYAQTVRKTQRKKGTIGGKSRSDIAKTARATGASNPNLVTAQKMKSISKGGTVGRGTHAAVAGEKGGGAKRVAAKDWRTKHMSAAGTDKVKRAKVQKRFKRMIGK